MTTLSYLAFDGTTRVRAHWGQNPIGVLTIHEELEDGKLGKKLHERFMRYDQFNFWRAVILRDSSAEAREITECY